jgi:hypothetical protein
MSEEKKPVVQSTAVKPYREGDQVLTHPRKSLSKKILERKDHFIKVLEGTDAEVLVMHPENILDIISQEDAQRHELFPWIVGTELTSMKKQKPTSVIPKSQLTEQKGFTEINREKLLRMLKAV